MSHPGADITVEAGLFVEIEEERMEAEDYSEIERRNRADSGEVLRDLEYMSDVEMDASGIWDQNSREQQEMAA